MKSQENHNCARQTSDAPSRSSHWEAVYEARPTESLGWFDPELTLSMTWIEELNLKSGANIIDVGGGSSHLVDRLLASGYTNLSVLDLSTRALAKTKERLGEKSSGVSWITSDILSAELPDNHFDVWHDRAMFHFFTMPSDSRRYINNLSKSLKSGGHVILGVFSKEAPPKCSGLPVNRYSLDEIQETFGTNYILEHTEKQLHVTPGGVEQMYLFCLLRKNG